MQTKLPSKCGSTLITFSLLLILCHLSLSQFGQAVVGREWTMEFGASSNTFFKNSQSLNLRFVSPRFRWSNIALTEEEEKHSEKFKNTRLMVEVIYSPPKQVVCTGFNVQSRFLGSKRLTLDIYGGMKFFWIPGPDFVRIPYLKAGRELWYMNLGLILQLNLGIVSPFADFGGDGILTIGTEVDLHKIYKKPKRRYKLHTQNADK
jgi:hypothetical protein